MSISKVFDAVIDHIDKGSTMGEIKSAALTARDQAKAQEHDLLKTQTLNDQLKKEIVAFQTTIANLEAEKEQLKAQVRKLRFEDDPTATELCPHCQRHLGKLVRSMAVGSGTTKYYRCTNPECGKDYDYHDEPPLPPRHMWRG